MAVLFLLMATSLCREVGPSQTPSVQWASEPAFNDLITTEPAESSDSPLTLEDCAANCASYSWCSSFFFNHILRSCMLHRIVYMHDELFMPESGAEYFRVSSDACPVEKCFYLSRPDSMCIGFFPDETLQKNQSERACESRGGHLAILDTRQKNQWIVELIKAHKGLQRSTVFLAAQLQGEKKEWLDHREVALAGDEESFWNIGITAVGTGCLALEVTPR